MSVKVCLTAALSLIPLLAGELHPTWIAGQTESGPTVVLIGGLNGRDSSSSAVEQALLVYQKTPQNKRKFKLAAIPLANPNREALVFPPTGTAYRENSQSHFIWRWLMIHAPDLVIVVGDQTNLGDIPTIHAKATSADILHTIPKIMSPSEAHKEHDRRLSRTPREVAEELSKFYGRDLDSPVYIQAVALISRLRMGQQTDVAALAEPYLNGSKDSMAKAASTQLAGHLIFAALAERTGDPRAIERVRAAADMAATDMDNEMSDSVFMSCPILASAGKLTGQATYFDMALQHLEAMQELDLRPDALYRHSPLSDAAWGRGNAFPALGLAWTLENIPENHPAYSKMVHSFQAHMATLAKFQDREGMWHEVIDDPESYAEFSATAMIATAMQRGVRRGWLDHTYTARVQAAWHAILIRTGPDGNLIDVCESTGKQKTKQAYLDRAASFGRDARGGGMAMLLATELMN